MSVRVVFACFVDSWNSLSRTLPLVSLLLLDPEACNYNALYKFVVIEEQLSLTTRVITVNGTTRIK